jgi:plasmid replication initiation protein
MMRLFKSKFSLILYEIIIDYQNISQTPIILLDDFKKLMGVSDKYHEFKRLNTRVISIALNEINSICNYNLKVDFIREKRFIIALKFTFKIASQKILQNLSNNKLQSPLLDELIKGFNLTTRQAQQILLRYPHPYIKESLELIKLKRRE